MNVDIKVPYIVAPFEILKFKHNLGKPDLMYDKICMQRHLKGPMQNGCVSTESESLHKQNHHTQPLAVTS